MSDPVTLDMSTAQPLQAAPVTLDMGTAQPIDSAASRLGSNLLSGLGITSNEQAKQFFAHPIKTFMDSIEAQGDLAKKAKDAYDKGDYIEAVQHGLNYLLPFIGQQTDQAGNQLKTGDIAGGIGRTLGAAIPIAAASPEVRAGVASTANAAADTGASAVRAVARGVNKSLETAPATIGATVGAGVGAGVGGHVGAEIGGIAGGVAGRELLPQVRIPGEGFGLPNRVTGGPAEVPNWREPDMSSPSESPAAPAPPGQTAPPAPDVQPITQEAPKTPNPPRARATKVSQVIKTLNQAEALRQPVQAIVDEAVPPANKAANLEAHAAVDFYLKKGNVAGAEAALDDAARAVNPNWPPPDFVRPDPVQFEKPATTNVDLRGVKSDLAEDQAIEDQVRSHVQTQDARSSFKKVSDAEMRQTEGYKTFFERNKSALKPATKPAITPLPGYTPIGEIPEDLTDLLQQSLAIAKKAKAQ